MVFFHTKYLIAVETLKLILLKLKDWIDCNNVLSLLCFCITFLCVSTFLYIDQGKMLFAYLQYTLICTVDFELKLINMIIGCNDNIWVVCTKKYANNIIPNEGPTWLEYCLFISKTILMWVIVFKVLWSLEWGSQINWNLLELRKIKRISDPQKEKNGSVKTGLVSLLVLVWSKEGSLLIKETSS